VDPFSKKDWYDIKAPSAFNVRNVGKTLVTRTQGTKVCWLGRGRQPAGVGLLALLMNSLQMPWSIAALRRQQQGQNSILPCRVQIASDGLKGRVIEVSLADLQQVRQGGSKGRLGWRAGGLFVGTAAARGDAAA
jgi:hypothetical protein